MESYNKEINEFDKKKNTIEGKLKEYRILKLKILNRIVMELQRLSQ